MNTEKKLDNESMPFKELVFKGELMKYYLDKIMSTENFDEEEASIMKYGFESVIEAILVNPLVDIDSKFKLLKVAKELPKLVSCADNVVEDNVDGPTKPKVAKNGAKRALLLSDAQKKEIFNQKRKILVEASTLVSETIDKYIKTLSK